MDDAPDACTLPSAERPLRLAEFDELFATSLRSGERHSPTRLRLRLAGADDLAATVRDLTDREGECCPFFEFTLDSAVELTIDVPPAYAGVLDALAARAGVR